MINQPLWAALFQIFSFTTIYQNVYTDPIKLHKRIYNKVKTTFIKYTLRNFTSIK